MGNIRQDKYMLGQSQSKNINVLGEEIRLDLDLKLNSIDDKDGLIYGTVNDTNGNAINNATVTLLDNDYNPLISTSTDAFGKFSFSDMPSSKYYKILAKADGKMTSQGSPFYLNDFEQVELNFNLKTNTNNEFSIIAGDVVDNDTKDAINNATVSIYKKDEQNEDILKAILYTNKYGQFVFREALIGKYVVNIKADSNQKSTMFNFQEKNINVEITETGSVIDLDIELDNIPVQNPLSPDFLDFRLRYTKNYRAGRYIASNGVMGNEAHVNDSTGFVRALGTYRRGFVSIDINVPQDGNYSIGVQYISVNERILSIFVNGQYPIEVYCYKTVGGLVSDARVRYIYLYLKKGINNLRFSNYFEQAGPEINEITLDILPFINTIQISEGTLLNQAQAIIGGYVANIGGPNNGKVIFSFNIPLSGEYVLDIKYLSSNTDYRQMKIYVDNDTYITGNFGPTPSSYITDGVHAQIDIGYLYQGYHEIEFYNDTGAYSIIPGPTQLKLLPTILTTTATEGTLGNGAKIWEPTGFAYLLGGANNGSITFNITIPYLATYSIGVEYINGDNHIGDMQVSINDDLYKYEFPKTPGTTVIDAKIFYFTVFLSSKSNTIKLFNNNASIESPAIRNIYLQEQLLNYHFTTGYKNLTLYGDARLDRGSLVGIGYNKGYAVMKLDNLVFSGKYYFLMQYITTDYTRETSLDVNNVSLGEPFPVIENSPTAINTLEIPVDLNNGTNTIKIYNTEYLLPPKSSSSYTPYFTSFELFYKQNYRIQEFKASTAILGNGVNVNPDTGFVRSIGGSTDGYVSMDINIPSSGAYSIGVQYLSFEEQMLSLAINGKHTVNVFCSSTGDQNVETSSKVYYISVYLYSGKNTLKFYNYFKLSSPEINIISVDVLPYATTINIADGTLEGGAIELDNGYIGNIGTEKYGSVTFKINCPITGHYVFGLMYLNAQYDRQMWISIDSIKGTLYEFKATPNNLASDGVEALIDVGYLEAGEHSVKYYSEIPLQSILPGRTQLRLIPNIIKSFAKDGLLQNGAERLSSGYVHKIGGSNKGAVKLTINTPFANKYSLGVEYVNGNGIIGDMKVSVNGSYPIKYIFPKTNGNNVLDAKIYYFNVELNSGDNVIKLYNDENVTVQSPVINKLIFQEILIDEIYKIPNNNIIYSGKARALDGKVVDVGYNEGDVTLRYPNLPFYGVYYLLVRYVTLNDNNTCNISVNNISPRAKYFFNKTNSLKEKDSNFIIIPVSFKVGTNTIKIYNQP